MIRFRKEQSSNTDGMSKRIIEINLLTEAFGVGYCLTLDQVIGNGHME